MVVLDTNILIDHLRQRPGVDTLLKKVVREQIDKDFGLSVLSIQELYEGRSTREHSMEQLLSATIASLRILVYTYDVAQRAGELARDLGRPISFPDAAIAATAILNEASLLTLNQKDFQDIEGLHLVKV